MSSPLSISQGAGAVFFNKGENCIAAGKRSVTATEDNVT
jgi:hypothetical protein